MSFRKRLLLASSNNENGNVGYEKQYFTIEALEDGIIIFQFADSDVKMFQASINGGSWYETYSADGFGVKAGDTIRLKRDYMPTSLNWVSIEPNSTSFNVYGNIHSLVFGDNFQVEETSIGYQYAFSNTKVVDASNLILPQKHASPQCYMGMFENCYMLTAAPKLPAITLADRCYYGMFQGCTSLIAAPELPVTTLADYCYANMFRGCTSLTTAPELPATTLEDYCYIYMFYGCTSLTTVPELPATYIAYDSYEAMFYGCSSLASIVLPATVISRYGCQYMFYNCSKLKRITMLATSIGTDGLRSWVKGVSSTGTFVKNPKMTTLPSGENGIPDGWTVQNSDGSPVTGGGSSGEGSTTASISWAVQTGSWTEGSNSSAKDGKQFTSVSPGSSGSTRLRCTFSGVTSITFNCVYNGENNYDYLTVGALDGACTRDSYATTLKGTSGTAKDITFSCGSGTHYVEFCYSKDSSVDTPPDCAVVYIKNYS